MNTLILALALNTTVIGWPTHECVRWSWTGDVYNRKVICLEWREKNNNQQKGDKNDGRKKTS
jgi:hypothetical protein